jgi:hypothetical protein
MMWHDANDLLPVAYMGYLAANKGLFACLLKQNK